MTDTVHFIPVGGIPLIKTGDHLPQIITHAIDNEGESLQDGDILVITSKIVSKAEGRWIDLRDVTPSQRDVKIARECEKDPREVAVIMSEATRVSRMRKNVLIVEHRLGFTCANAGVDHSNTGEGENLRLLLPYDPDRSAREFRLSIQELTGKTVAVILSDSHGRPFRMGTVGIAVGSSGLPALRDMRGQPDLFGNALRVTQTGFADELAAGAGLILGQADEGIPAVIIRGLTFPRNDVSGAADLVRPPELDLFR